MANGTKTVNPSGFNKGGNLKSCVGSWIWQTPEFGRHIGHNNEDEDNSLKTLNDKNHQALSQTFQHICSLSLSLNQQLLCSAYSLTKVFTQIYTIFYQGGTDFRKWISAYKFQEFITLSINSSVLVKVLYNITKINESIDLINKDILNISLGKQCIPCFLGIHATSSLFLYFVHIFFFFLIYISMFSLSTSLSIYLQFSALANILKHCLCNTNCKRQKNGLRSSDYCLPKILSIFSALIFYLWLTSRNHYWKVKKAKILAI